MPRKWIVMLWNIFNVDGDDERSYKEQAQSAFAAVLQLFLDRIDGSESGLKTLVSAYNEFSPDAKTLKPTTVKEYLSARRQPEPAQAFQIGEALGTRDPAANPAGANCHEASGLLMLIAAGHLDHALLLIDRVLENGSTDRAMLGTYLAPISWLLQVREKSALQLLMPLPKQVRRELVTAWDEKPKAPPSRAKVGAELVDAWNAATHPTAGLQKRCFHVFAVLGVSCFLRLPMNAYSKRRIVSGRRAQNLVRSR